MTEEEDATKETAHIVEYLAQNKNVLKASFRSKPHCIEQPHSIILFMIFQELLTEEPLLFKKVLDKIKNPDKDCQRIVSGPEKTRNGPAAAKNVPDAEDISGNIFIRNNDELNSSLLSDSGR